MRACWVMAILLLGPGLLDAAPLRYVPKTAATVVVVDQPRAMIEDLTAIDAIRKAQTLPLIQQAIASPGIRRLFQIVEYYERDLGAKWPEVLDKVAGKGLVLAIGPEPDPAPTLLVAEGTDESAVAEFYASVLRVLEAELTRQAADGAEPAKLRKAKHHGIETVHLGMEFHAARVGTTIFVSNREAALKAALDLAHKPGPSAADRPGPILARELFGNEPLAWLWFNLERIQQTQGGKDFFAATKKDFLQTLVLGSNIDAVRRAPYLAAGLVRSGPGLALRVRLPAKRSEMDVDIAGLHTPPAGQPGSLPLLEPEGVAYSQSFYLDLGKFWSNRQNLINDQQRKDFEKAERDVSRLIPGLSIGKLLEASGPYHRIVSVPLDTPAYSIVPEQVIPPFAVVTSTRDPSFAKSIDTTLRGAGLLATLNFGLTQKEEVIDGVKVVSYRFPEKGTYPGDEGNIRFNFVPSYAIVGSYLVTSSRPELIRRLIPELKKSPPGSSGDSAVWRAKSYGSGVAKLLRQGSDPLVADAVLRQGIGIDEARKQVEQLIDWVGQVGVAGISFDHGPTYYQVELAWTP